MTSDLNAWHDLWVMSGGAAAALAGLIFVAVATVRGHPPAPCASPLLERAASLQCTAVPLLVDSNPSR